MHSKSYSFVEKNLVSKWMGWWQELALLLNEVTGNTQPPTATDEIQYQMLRSLLIDHQDQFTLLWKDFEESPEYDAYRDSDMKRVIQFTRTEGKYPDNYSPQEVAREKLVASIWDEVSKYEKPHRLSDFATGPGDLPDLDRYLECPFSFFYEPDNLFDIAYHLGLQDRRHVWEPSEYWLRLVRPVLVGFFVIMVGFERWISERTL